jgi:hypothetical protein
MKDMKDQLFGQNSRKFLKLRFLEIEDDPPESHPLSTKRECDPTLG